jgi:hypothetical protein
MAPGRGDYQRHEVKKTKKDVKKAPAVPSIAAPPPEPAVIPKGKAAKKREEF